MQKIMKTFSSHPSLVSSAAIGIGSIIHVAAPAAAGVEPRG